MRSLTTTVATEVSCGCIYHPLAGRIRKCNGLTNRSLSGKIISASPDAVMRHKNAETVRVYQVANILP